ncbi:hypothetical protein KP78_10780 [Jeotgalibacillus soli]|uniref:Peptidase M20 dimerisation domain-containing protein n=2 Tax=Jeotgalibacillus soli TaxID=889306 RepID=A0A0C2RHG6_9BACL|nr:hypothetical protein KP78_10780 [Jeotgalibacillus soli]
MKNIFSRDRLMASMNEELSYPFIDAKEVAEKLALVNEFGQQESGGFSRPPFGEQEILAHNRFKEWLKELGLDVHEDAVGNLFGRWEGEDPSLPIVLTGSHLDSVPHGGAFDGPLGCISSLLAVKALKASGYKPKRSVEVVVFRDEEGTRFFNGLFGSRALMGEITAESLHQFVDDNGISMYDAMEKEGYLPKEAASCYRDPKTIECFLELHIEQGKKLEQQQKKIGVVTGIAGPSWRTFTFHGSTDHAGNTPMNSRKDSVAAAAEWITEIEKLPALFSETAVATVGRMVVTPNGTNVISGHVEADVDVRDIDASARDRLVEEITKKAHEIAEKRGLTVSVKDGVTVDPMLVPDHIQSWIQEAAEQVKVGSMKLHSGAGHDAMNIGKYTHAGMIFVPSVNGKSHSPEEWTTLDDCVIGVKVLSEVIKKASEQ